MRAQPQAGESLTSWLCAYARTNNVTWRQILTAVGLHRRRGDMKNIGWAGYLHTHEINTLAAATAVDTDQLRSMTLHRFQPLGITAARRPTHIDYGTLTATARPTRYCPQCLSENGGRWQLTWLLGWTFACTRHRRLLADTCPRCGRPPMRAAPLTDVVPDLRFCTQSGGGHGHTVCGADLRGHKRRLAASSAMLAAQHTINTLSAGDTTTFPLYAPHTATPARALADLRALARDMATSYAAPKHRPGQPNIDTCIDRVADAFTIATRSLTAPDITRAAMVIRTFSADAPTSVSARLQRAVVTASSHPRVAAAELAALDPDLPIADVLRFRTCTPRPAIPRRPEATLTSLARRLPTLLWAPWVTYILGNDDDSPVIRRMLACAVAHVGTTAPTAAIATMLGNTARDAAVVYAALRSLAECPSRSAVAGRIIELADHLAATPARIDYHRRRRLDYTDLLADRRSGTPVAFDALRCLAFEHLSGLPRAGAPWYRETAAFARRCHAAAAAGALEEPGVLTSMEEFLQRQGIAEPPVAVPALHVTLL
nr:TniQ family protein [Mycolicibacterium parafortuitum]